MDKTQDDTIPPTEPTKAKAKTNPTVGQPADPALVQAERGTGTATATKPEAKHKVKGAALVPDFSGDGAGVEARYTYWVGVTPNCPVEGIDVAGINFPKLNERLIPDPSRKGGHRRVPVIGALVTLTERHVRALTERLPRKVMRFLDNDEGEREEQGTGQNLGDLHVRPRKGFPLEIPTKAECDQRASKGKPTKAYQPRKGDEPAARYMFAQLCADQDKPARGDFYPDVLENTGLDWPEVIKE
jgi:hypothetical protein